LTPLPYNSASSSFDETEINYTPDVSPRFEKPMEEDPQCLVFVHGWRMSYEDSVSFSETMFKRLWWQGYKGRFAAFRWATQTSFHSYNTSEWIAWKYGKSLANYVENYLKHQMPSYTMNIAAHSMGNIVTGSALKRGMTVNNYMLMQAAVPSGCYDDRVNDYGRFINEEDTRPTPDTDVQKGYRLLLQPVSNNVGKFTSFFNIDDYALATGITTLGFWPLEFETNWEKNEIDYKPDVLSTGHYSYDGVATSYFVNTNSPDRVVSDIHECLSFVARPRSKAAGAEVHNATVFGSVMNLEGSCNFGADFGDHGGQFMRPIQQLEAFYERVFNELKQ
jgi:hypothetical protein